MKKILIANRGEIALRIMRSVKEMGLDTVAVFSEADRKMPFVRYADEAVCIGEAEARLSYLNIERIIEVCLELGVDAVHPGYGFLSENSKFAVELEKAGVTLIGPSATSIEIMGDKLKAKEAVSKYDIPLVPGSKGEIVQLAEAQKVALEIGYPVMIKAAAGGGGKGMRIAKNESQLAEGFSMAVSEAISAFGNGAVFIEKYIENPRHIEFQILADTKGNVVHLFERDCSIQRRHQKVIEEAPSVCLSEKNRQEMGKCAIQVARSCSYIGAGTVEFIVDKNQNYYFLEMNTRLQVEHPITEMITGIDLVKEQICIAKGEPLNFKQEDLRINGHAIECRVYAEDPSNNFLPDTGVLKFYKTPSGRGVRVDDGYEEGGEVSVHYDPMISKLIVHAANRSEAIIRMKRAIEDYRIIGVETTLGFCEFVLNHDDFTIGAYDTNFVQQNFKAESLIHSDSQEEDIAAIMAAFIFSENNNYESVAEVKASVGLSNWYKNRK